VNGQPTISRFSGSRPLGKAIDVDVVEHADRYDRVLIKTPLANAVRHVQTVEVPDARALAEVVRTCEIDKALALGTCGRATARVVVADKLTEELRLKGAVTRTKHNTDVGTGFFRFSDGPGWALIDVDAGVPAIAKRLGSFNGAWSVLLRACPSLRTAARVMRLSQSARLIVHGEPRFWNLSARIYVLLERQSDAAAPRTPASTSVVARSRTC
jgi:hypothetical protein